MRGSPEGALRASPGGPVSFTLLLTILALPASAGAAASDDWRGLLEKRISPGTVALLVAHATEPGVMERWDEALRDARPEVRAAAARVANVSGAAPLVPRLLALLRAETDTPAALEEIRALAALGGPAVDEALIEAARHDPGLAEPLASTLARARGASARLHLAALRDMGLDPAGLSTFFRRMIEVEPESIDALGSVAVRDGEAHAWAVVLNEAREGERPLGDAILIASLTSSSSRVRNATYWHLLLADEPVLPDDIERALQSTPEALGEETDPLSTFAVELLRRRRGRRGDPRPEWMELLRNTEGPDALPEEIRLPHILKTLSGEERWTLSLARTGKPDGLGDGGPVSSRRSSPEADRLGSSQWDDMRLPSDHPPGFVSDLREATGCRGSASSVGGGVVRYRRDGRPETVALFAPESSCPEFVRTLLMTTLAPPRARLEHPAALVIPLAPDTLACMAAPVVPPSTETSGSPSPMKVGGHIREPRKIRNVSPVYPLAAKEARIQGTVVLEAVISTEGCVRELRLLESVPALDLAAFVAVAQWRYTPTLLNGEPVPVIMTVTVRFKLT